MSIGRSKIVDFFTGSHRGPNASASVASARPGEAKRTTSSKIQRLLDVTSGLVAGWIFGLAAYLLNLAQDRMTPFMSFLFGCV